MDRKKTLKIALPLGIAVLALAAVGVGAALRPGGPPPAPYDTAEVTRGRVAAVVTASGTISPLVTVQVGSQVSGRIQALHADFNSRVRKGQVIARIDPSLFESQVAQARANEAMAAASVQAAQAARDEARRQHDRVAGLGERGLVAQAEADTALSRLQAAEAELVSARARVAQSRAARVQAETNLAYTTITSPIDGVVISRDVDVGQTVAASLQAPTLFTLAEDLRRMEVHTDVAEADVGRIRAGMPVEFTVDAFPGDRFQAVVKEVRYSPKTVQNVVTYNAVVTADNPDLKLRPGMTASVSFVVEELEDTLLVPNAALRFRPPDQPAPAAGAARPPSVGDGPVAAGPGPRAAQGPPRGGEGAARRGGGRRDVWVLAGDGALRQVTIQVGPSDGRNTAVLGGELAPGDRVVTGTAGSAAARPGGSGPGAGRFGRFL